MLSTRLSDTGINSRIIARSRNKDKFQLTIRALVDRGSAPFAARN